MHADSQAALGAQQVIPNGEFATGDLRGWTGVPETWSVIQRGSSTAAAVQSAPRLMMLAMPQSAEWQQATAVTDVPVRPGETFAASLWGATWGSGTARVEIRYVWQNAVGDPLGTVTTVGHTFTGSAWTQAGLAPVSAPEGAASLTVRIRRDGGGYGTAYLVSARVERVGSATADALARVETIEGAYVDKHGAIAAVEETISAEFGGLEAMAQATSFAKATADGIAAGYVWRLNGENLVELVSVADGMDGPVSTFKIDADYLQITSITQMKTAVITDLVATAAFVENLTVTRGNITDTLASDDYTEGPDGFPSAGLKLDFSSGVIKAARGVLTRSLIVAEGDFDPGLVTVSPTLGLHMVDVWDLIPTGITQPVDQVWMPQEKTYIAYAAFSGAATAPGGISGLDEFWGCTATVQPFARWNGPQQLYLRVELWAKGISALHSKTSTALPGRIHWKLYEVS